MMSVANSVTSILFLRTLYDSDVVASKFIENIEVMFFCTICMDPIVCHLSTMIESSPVSYFSFTFFQQVTHNYVGEDLNLRKKHNDAASTISSYFSSNSEESASELLENTEETLPCL